MYYIARQKIMFLISYFLSHILRLQNMLKGSIFYVTTTSKLTAIGLYYELDNNRHKTIKVTNQLYVKLKIVNMYTIRHSLRLKSPVNFIRLGTSSLLHSTISPRNHLLVQFVLIVHGILGKDLLPAELSRLLTTIYDKLRNPRASCIKKFIILLKKKIASLEWKYKRMCSLREL